MGEGADRLGTAVLRAGGILLPTFSASARRGAGIPGQADLFAEELIAAQLEGRSEVDSEAMVLRNCVNEYGGNGYFQFLVHQVRNSAEFRKVPLTDNSAEKMLRDALTAGLEKLRRGIGHIGECLFWAESVNPRALKGRNSPRWSAGFPLRGLGVIHSTHCTGDLIA